MMILNKIISVIVVGLILFSGTIWLETSQSRNETPFVTYGKVKFHTSIESGINEANNFSKPVFLYFWSEACYWCIRFEGEALSDEKVINILNENFVLITTDIFKQKNVALNYNVKSTPYMIFFTKDGEEIIRIPGYLPTDEFLIKLNEVLERS